MSLPVHTIDVLPGSAQAQKDRVTFANLVGVANSAGGGAGQSVTVAVALALPASYSVMVNPGQDATWYVSGKTTTGFNVTLTPRLAANTLASGTFDVLVHA